MTSQFFVTIEFDHPGTGCSHARCATRHAGGYWVEDNTGTRKILCAHCLAALLEVCQPSPVAAGA